MNRPPQKPNQPSPEQRKQYLNAVRLKAALFDLIITHGIQLSNEPDGWRADTGLSGCHTEGRETDAVAGATALEAIKNLCIERLKANEIKTETQQWQAIQNDAAKILERPILPCECCGKPAIPAKANVGNRLHSMCSDCLGAGIMPWNTLKQYIGKLVQPKDIKGFTLKQIEATCAHFGKSVNEFWAEVNQ